MAKVIWNDAPAEHDYPAAESYLSLLTSEINVANIVEQLHKATIEMFKAKDVIRASRLKLLPQENFHVKRDLKKIRAKTPLTPLLLVRGAGASYIPLTIADGYHRACAVYLNSEDDFINAKVADWPS
jgi:hypothetical protein